MQCRRWGGQREVAHGLDKYVVEPWCQGPAGAGFGECGWAGERRDDVVASRLDGPCATTPVLRTSRCEALLGRWQNKFPDL